MYSLIDKVLSKLYRLLKNSDDRLRLHNRVIHLAKVCSSEEDTNIGNDAMIENATSDKTRIIIGKNSWIRGYLMVYNHGGVIEIGNDSFVGPGSRIWSAKKIKIGNRVLIAHDVNIHDNISHPLNSAKRNLDYLHIVKEGRLQDQNDLREEEIVIGDDVWIGFNATILKGVTVGNGAIIGANAVITRNVPPYAVVVNETEQKIIKYVI